MSDISIAICMLKLIIYYLSKMLTFGPGFCDLIRQVVGELVYK